ncbi:Galactomannan galactosyltransferase 1 [Camellia lanceoleosa]|uniref:Galactomannan galactosyltransferase 1 n=1 Tax=Camellia lanceoleosa TaxID=1840588 RepID=A0ACC0G8W7_9ERIC|nr:Galactomannan galactosyltransferase 1 [Camellia lanceoleosa]
MAKRGARTKAWSFLSDGLLFVGGVLVALLTVWALSSFINPNPSSGFSENETKASISSKKRDCAGGVHRVNLHNDPDDPTFYDHPELSYSIGGQEIKSWDEKRWDWLKHHLSYPAGVCDRILREPNKW